MEKFAVDLDKVLDEFEFNEDCAEQTIPTRNVTPRTSVQTEKNVYHPEIETLDIRKPNVQSPSESVNDCKRGYHNDKVQTKRSVDLLDPGEPVSLTIHNDISQKFAQKKQNEKNSYDKKLNQPNIKPSVSNVFSSLNEYINASSATMERIDCSVDRQECKNTESRSNIVQDEIVHQSSDSPRAPPEYQNILLPIKCDEPVVEVPVAIPVLETASEHVYENIPLVKDCENDLKPEKHVYENVDVAAGPGDAYECIYLEPEPTKNPDTRQSEPVAEAEAFQEPELKPIGFSTLDDLSEEDFNKYLAELEAEERAKEAVYENVPVYAENRHDDEDANEAPIFETVTIGELPKVSEEELQQKAKKFPVIDYSTSADTSDFLGRDPPENLGVLKTVEKTDKTSEEIKATDDEALAPLVNGVSVSEAESSQEDDVHSPSEELKPVTEVANSPSVAEETLDDNEASEADADRPPRPQTLDIVAVGDLSTDSRNTAEDAPAETVVRDPSPDASDNSSMEFGIVLGKQPPFWVPDSDAPNCMQCAMRFSLIKRRHHCRACGKVLCHKCCSMKYRLQYQGNMDSRVCSPCYQLLIRAESEQGSGEYGGYGNSAGINSPQGRQPNPNNPMEYCSTIPPLQQLAGVLPPPPPTVMVPVGVLKREGSTKQRAESSKSVMFSDGIRPGCDLTELDSTWDLKPPYRKVGNKRIPSPGPQSTSATKRQNLPPLDPHTNSYIPQDPNLLPPTVTIYKGQISYHEADPAALLTSLKNECEPPVMFAINRNLYAYVKITNLNCCVNRICWNVTSRGLACMGQDEVILLVETLPDETKIPKDLLTHINQIYTEAAKGNTITELGVSIHADGNLLGSREHAGFLFIRATFQCLQKIVLPPAPYLVGLLVHRWESPWAKVFPLRLVLRLGAEYRYYPCPLVSVRFREAVYFEIGHTIMKVLADFRNYTYTLPGVRGLTIHMQDRTTDVQLPRNRYDQVIKGLNNSNDHVLAFASNFSTHADSHLVCIQTNTGDESSYQTQAINIHNKPRKVTGASFIVINGALKSSMGLSAKSSIVEDGIMVQIMPEKMDALKVALKNMQDFSIGCGRAGAAEPDETVNIIWTENDVQFNLGVKSPIDGKPLDGVPSIRVHNGADYMGSSRFIRWTEVFIIKADDHPNGLHDPVDINKLSENIARGTCAALVKLLDLLATAGLTKLGVRTTIHPDNVGYEAGSEGTRLPPIYMNSLDNELIQVLHKAVQSSTETNIVLELIFHVLDD